VEGADPWNFSPRPQYGRRGKTVNEGMKLENTESHVTSGRSRAGASLRMAGGGKR
jgi:hypothetical protein